MGQKSGKAVATKPAAKPHKPAMPQGVHYRVGVSVIHCRQQLHNLIAELEGMTPRWSNLIEDLKKAKEQVEASEQRLMRGYRRDHPSAQPPSCTLY